MPQEQTTDLTQVMATLREELGKEFLDGGRSGKPSTFGLQRTNEIIKEVIKNPLDSLEKAEKLTPEQKKLKLICVLACMQLQLFSEEKPCESIERALTALGIDNPEKKQTLKDLTQRFADKQKRVECLGQTSLEAAIWLGGIGLGGAIKNVWLPSSIVNMVTNQPLSYGHTNLDVGVLAALGAVCLISLFLYQQQRKEPQKQLEQGCLDLLSGKGKEIEMVNIAQKEQEEQSFRS